MGTVSNFEDRAVAKLRARVAAAEEANQDLIAFARGHSGAVASIHEAVLAAVEAEGFDHLIHIVTQEWPQILGLDAVAVALFVGDKGIRADASGLQFVNPRVIERSVAVDAGEGFVYTGFRTLMDFLSGGSIDDVEKRNEEIKQAAERLRSQIEESNQRLERERASYEREIMRLEATLAQQRSEYEASKADMERIRRMNYREYFDSLPPEERRKLQDDLMEGVQVL